MWQLWIAVVFLIGLVIYSFCKDRAVEEVSSMEFFQQCPSCKVLAPVTLGSCPLCHTPFVSPQKKHELEERLGVELSQDMAGRLHHLEEKTGRLLYAQAISSFPFLPSPHPHADMPEQRASVEMMNRLNFARWLVETGRLREDR